MKTKLKFLVFGIVLLVGLNLFFNAKTHNDTVKSVKKLEIESDKVLTRAPDGVVNPTSAPGTLILKSTFLSLLFFRS